MIFKIVLVLLQKIFHKQDQQNLILIFLLTIDRMYPGRTSQYLHNRLDQHFYRTTKYNPTHSTLCEHSIQDHSFDFTNCKKIHRCKYQLNRKKFESLFINLI